MGGAGLFSDEEQLRLTFPVAQRSLSDIQAPFDRNGYFAGLKIEHAEIVAAPDPFWDEFQKTGDADDLGHCWANMMRAVFAPTIIAAIDPRRDRSALVDDLFARFIVRITSAPKKHEHYFAVVVTLAYLCEA
jgi:hypothetical protein